MFSALFRTQLLRLTPKFIRSTVPNEAVLLLCVFMFLASPLAAQTVDVPDACKPSVNDPEAASYKVDYNGNGLLEICYLEDLNAMRYALDGSAYTTSTDAMPNTSGCPTPSGATEPRCNGYELVRDLDFLDPNSYKDATSNLALYTEGTGWQPVGRFGADVPFTAAFNGNRYTLSNLRIDRPDTNQVALFGHIGGGSVRNVGLLNVRIRGSYRVGGLVGWAINARIAGNYVTEGSVEGTSDNEFTLGVGGLIGEVRGGVSGNYTNVAVIARVTGGGLTGYFHGSSLGTINNNYAAGNVVGNDTAGGFIGIMLDNQIRGSYNYARGAVSGNSNVGGFVGFVRDVRLTGNHWDVDASGQRSSAGEGFGRITSLTTVQMTAPTVPGTTVTEAYYNWDPAYWDFGSELQYPALRYTTANSALGQKVGDLLGHQRSRLDNLTVSPRPDATTPNLITFSPERFHYDLVVPHTSKHVAVQPLPDARHATLTIIVNDTPQPTTGDAPYIINLNEIGTYTTITVTAKRPYYVMAEHYTIAVFRATPPTLSTLTLSDGALAFDEDTIDYELAVANSIAALTVEATASDPNAEVAVYRNHIAESQRESLDAPIALAAGTTTTLLIRVTVPDRGENLYTIRVKRAPSANAKLASLGFAHDAELIAFDAAEAQYNVEIEGRQRVTVVLETADEHASVVVESNDNPITADIEGNYPIDLTVKDKTKIEIFITAQDRITMESYTIVVTQRVGAQAMLIDLRLTDATDSKDFETTTQTPTLYRAEVAVSTQTRLYLIANYGAKIEVMADSRRVSTQTQAESEYYPITLAVSTVTQIAITITAQDGKTTRNYTLTITHQASSQAQLNNLKLSHGILVPDFSATTFTYRLAQTTHTHTYLTLSASVAATISVSAASEAILPNSQGSYPIDLSQLPVQITITSQDGETTRIYTLTAARPPQPPADAIYIRSRIFLEAPLP